jgi:hypothetical protein
MKILNIICYIINYKYTPVILAAIILIWLITTTYLILVAPNNIKTFISIPLLALNLLMWGGLFGKDEPGDQINCYKGIMNNKSKYPSWKI